MSQIVARTFGIDFIYFDLLLVSIWIVLLLIRRRYKQLAIGFFGYGVTHFTDAVLWYTIKGTRHIEIEGDVIGPHLFLWYFSFTYGMIMFSYAVLMYDKKIHYIEKILWSALMWGGWLIIGLVSQNLAWNDTLISISRDMSSSRVIQIVAVAVEYFLLITWKVLSNYIDKYPFKLMKTVPWWFIGVVFLVGVFIHFSMESTLMIAGIRPTDWGVMAFNSLLEFNTGAPVLFMMWIAWNWKEYIPKIPKLTSEELEISVTAPLSNETH